MEKKDNTIYVIFRNDDPCALSDAKHERRVLEVFEKYRVPQVLAVIPKDVDDPHDCYSKNFHPLEENPEMVALLKEYHAKGLAEIAQHGYTHQTNIYYPSISTENTTKQRYNGIAGQWLPFEPAQGKYSEFEGLSYQDKKEKISLGKEYLEKIFGFPLQTFIFPWNSVDDECLDILADFGFKSVMAGYACHYRHPKLNLLCSSHENIWETPILTEEILQKDEPVVMHLLTHSWTISEEQLVKIDKILNILSSNKRVRFITTKDLEELMPRIEKVAFLNKWAGRVGIIADPYLERKVTPAYYSFDPVYYFKRIFRGFATIVICKWFGKRLALGLITTGLILSVLYWFFVQHHWFDEIAMVFFLLVLIKLLTIQVKAAFFIYPKKRRKILFVSYGAGLYGSEKCLLLLLQKLNPTRYEPIVLVKEKWGLSEELERRGVRIVILPLDQWIAFPHNAARWHLRELIEGMPHRVAGICRLIEDEKIDLVYTNAFITVDGAIAAKIKRVPHIVHIHEILNADDFLKPHFPLWFIRLATRFLCKRMIAVSHASKNVYEKDNLSQSRFRVVYNASEIEPKDIPHLSKENDLIRERFKLPQDTKIIVSIGRYHDTKGMMELIGAASIVTKQYPKSRFVVVGSGFKHEINRWNSMIKEFRLEEKFLLLEFQRNLLPVYQHLDILVSASWVDACPRNILDGMMMGNPIVATHCGGPSELIVDGETGLMVPIKSVRPLAEAIMKFLADPEMAKRMGQAGQERAIKLFNIDRYVKEVEGVIEEALN